LKSPRTKHLKLKCDILLSTFAFKFNLRRYIQAFQRFILEQLHKEESAKDDKPGKYLDKEKDKAVKDKGGGGGGRPGTRSGGRGGGGGGAGAGAGAGDGGGGGAGGAENVTCGGVETLFATSSKQTHRCAQCKGEEVRSVRSFQTDLQYPACGARGAGAGAGAKAGAGAAPLPTFAQCLAGSLATTQEVRAWCEGHSAYTRMAQERVPTQLPQVLSINLVWRCRLMVSKPDSKARLVSALETKM